ncbi:hypothetical protein THAOC_03263, partial [Thalassiosira oceanica]
MDGLRADSTPRPRDDGDGALFFIYLFIVYVLTIRFKTGTKKDARKESANPLEVTKYVAQVRNGIRNANDETSSNNNITWVQTDYNTTAPATAINRNREEKRALQNPHVRGVVREAAKSRDELPHVRNVDYDSGMVRPTSCSGPSGEGCNNYVLIIQDKDAYPDDSDLQQLESRSDFYLSKEDGWFNPANTKYDAETHQKSGWKYLPDVFLSGAVHGNERVGPTALMEMAELLLEAAYCESLPRTRYRPQPG